MGQRTSTPQTASPGDFPTNAGTGPRPQPGTEASPGPTLKLGEALVQTIRHFWPNLNHWLDQVPDTRFFPYVVYDKRFLIWWGLGLYLFKLGSRRQLDFDLDARGTQVLANFNRLADTQQQTRPVHKTLNHFLGHTGAAPYARLRTALIRRLLRMKALASARLQGYYVGVADATGHLCFRRPHCPQCLVQRHQNYTLYLHQVLEFKLLGPAGLTLSAGTEFIENADATDTPADGSPEERKQDCELKALSRLLPALRRDFPQLRLCLSGDGLYACGRTLQLAKDHGCAYVLTFKSGQLPAVWADFQSLLPLCAAQVLERTTPEGACQVYRWVHDLCYQDSDKRTWQFHAIQCEETVAGQTTTFAWITNLHVSKRTVVEIATKGGRPRWQIENQGFNMQKNSGFNLEHVYSTDPELLKAYYLLLQIAHIILQVLEAGSLLRRLAAEWGQTPGQLFGSLKNIARRLLESFRYCFLSATAFDRGRATRLPIRFDSS